MHVDRSFKSYLSLGVRVWWLEHASSWYVCPLNFQLVFVATLAVALLYKYVAEPVLL